MHKANENLPVFSPADTYHTNLVRGGNILHAENYVTIMDLTWGRKGIKGKVLIVLCSCFSEIILM